MEFLIKPRRDQRDAAGACEKPRPRCDWGRAGRASSFGSAPDREPISPL